MIRYWLYSNTNIAKYLNIDRGKVGVKCTGA